MNSQMLIEGSGASTGRLEFEAFQELYLKAKEYNPNNPSIGVIPDYNIEKMYGHGVR